MYRYQGKRCLDIFVHDEFSWHVINAALNWESLPVRSSACLDNWKKPLLEDISRWRQTFRMRILTAGNYEHMTQSILQSSVRRTCFVGVVNQLYLVPMLDDKKVRDAGMLTDGHGNYSPNTLRSLNELHPGWENVLQLDVVGNDKCEGSLWSRNRRHSKSTITEAAKGLLEHYATTQPQIVEERERASTFNQLQQLYANHFNLFCWRENGVGYIENMLLSTSFPTWQDTNRLKTAVINGTKGLWTVNRLVADVLTSAKNGVQLRRFLAFLAEKAQMYSIEKTDDTFYDAQEQL